MNKYRKDHDNLYEAFNKVQEKQQLLNELHQLQNTLNEKGGWLDKTLAKSPIMNKLAGGVSARAQQRVGSKGDVKLMQQKFNQTLGGLGKDVDAEQFKGWLKQNTGVDASSLPEVQQLSGRIPNKQVMKMMPKLVDDMRAIKMSGTTAQAQVEPQDPNSVMGGAPAGGAPAGGAPAGGDANQQIQNLQGQLTDDNPDTPDEIAQLKAQIAELQKQLGQSGGNASGGAPAASGNPAVSDVTTGTDTTGADTTGTDTTGTDIGTDTTGADTTGTDTTGTDIGTDTSGGIDQDVQGTIDGMSPDELDEFEKTLASPGVEEPGSEAGAEAGGAPAGGAPAGGAPAGGAPAGGAPATGPTEADVDNLADAISAMADSGKSLKGTAGLMGLTKVFRDTTGKDLTKVINIDPKIKQIFDQFVAEAPTARSNVREVELANYLLNHQGIQGGVVAASTEKRGNVVSEQRKYNTLGSMGFMSDKWGRFNEK